jgi:D-alanyl-D-alanine carboxypeptidase
MAGSPGAARPGGDGPRLVYSVTKSFVAALFRGLADRGEVDLDASVAEWVRDARLPAGATLRRLLLHTSGIPDYARIPAYAEEVRRRPGRPWSDEELLGRALALGVDFAPGAGWAYSNTGYLLLRLVARQVTGRSLGDALRERVLDPLGLHETRVAEVPADLEGLEPGPSEELGGDVGGRYHPAWVGHRALVSTAADQHRFWCALAAGELGALAEPGDLVEVGRAAPGFVRPSYGLGVMADPESPLGLVVGHGGGGPGYAAGCFAVLRREGPVAAVVLASGDGDPSVQETALRLLGEAVTAAR